MNTESNIDTPGGGKFHPRRIAFMLLIFLSIGGIGIMDYSREYALWYWLAMAPVFAAASLSLAWKTAHEKDTTAGKHIQRQLLHWSVLVVAVLMVFLMQRLIPLSSEVSGMLALLMLALACLYAGVHFEWRMAILGGVLLITFVAGVMVESVFWILLIPAVLGIALLLRGKGYDKV